MSTLRIGLLGGTFDPIHNGHLDLADAADKALNLTRIHVVPAKIPPHRAEPLASPFQRFAMVVLAVGKRPSWRASDLELRVDEPSYTSTTLARFHERGYDRHDLFFIIGADAFVEIHTWHEYPKVLSMAHFVVVSRPGTSVDQLPYRLPNLKGRMVRPPVDDIPREGETSIFLVNAPTADVSGNAIRKKCEAGESIDGLMPALVQQYIEQHGVYGPRFPGRRASDRRPPSPAGPLHGRE